MKYFLEKLKIDLAQKINQILEKEYVSAHDFLQQIDAVRGDLSLPCFVVAKQTKKVPAKIAVELAKHFPEAKAVGPYLNFYFSKKKFSQEILEQINQDYGINEDGAGKKIMIEYSNVNTHKQYHLGHLRNIVYGDTINRLLLSNGYDALPVTYVNDFGIHVAKTIWWLKQENNPQNIKKMLELNSEIQDWGYYLGEMYAEAVQQLENNESGKQEVAQIMKNIEARQGEDYELWQKTRQWSLDYFQSIYQRLKIKFERSYYENEVIEQGVKLVQQLLEQGILEKSKGAIIANLEKYDLGVLVFIRSDGTALYPVADLALAQKKAQEKLYQSIYIVDQRQSLYFKQLFKVLELIGHQEKLIHLDYDFVKLPSGMMSSRSGNIISFEDIYQQTIAKIIQETKERHPDWSANDLEEKAKIVAQGVLKFEMIKVSAHNIITFDIQQALRFDGFTSVYLQYSIARINSIFAKAKQKQITEQVDYNQLTAEQELNLIWFLAKYPEIVKNAGQNYEPAQLAKYLFDLAKLFNDYYQQINILKAETATKQARLYLLQAIKQVLVNGLDILGIEILDKM